MIKYIFLVISLVYIPIFSYAEAQEIPKSIDSCGPRFQQFKKHFEKLGLSEQFAGLYTDYAIDGFINDNKDIEPNKVSELRSLLKSTFNYHASVSGGFVDIASCYYSINKPYVDFQESDFQELERTYNIVKSISMGSQLLDWIAREWCAENWGAMLLQIQAQSNFSVPNFTPIMLCNK